MKNNKYKLIGGLRLDFFVEFFKDAYHILQISTQIFLKLFHCLIVLLSHCLIVKFSNCLILKFSN